MAATEPSQPTLRAPVLAVALLAACAYAAFAHGGVRIPEESRLQVGIDLVALCAVAAWLSRRGAPRAAPAGWMGVALLTAFAAWSAVSMLWSVAPDDSWLQANRSLTYALVALLAIGLGTSSARAIERVALGWLAIATAVALYALAGKAAPGAVAPDELIARLRLPLEYWNALALVCAMAVPVGMRVATDVSRRGRVRLAGLASVYVLTLTMGLTYSRGGFLALAVALVVLTALGAARLRGLAVLAMAGIAIAPVLAVAFSRPGLTENAAPLGPRIHDGRIFAAVAILALALLLGAGVLAGKKLERRVSWTRSRSRWTWRVLGVLALAVVIAGGAYVATEHDRVWHSFTDVRQDRQYDPARLVSTNSANRWVWWKEAAGAFSDKPVGGWGAGSFGTVHLRYREQPLGVRQPHNVELQWLSETGIVGFVLALGGLMMLFAAAVPRVRRMAPSRERDLGVALLAAAAGWLVHGLVDWDWDIPAVTLPPLIFLGLLAARPGPPRRSEPFADPEERGIGARAFALAGVALLLCGAMASAILPAWSQSRTEAAETAASPEAGARAADVAARLDPVAVRPLLVEASIDIRRGRVAEARQRLLEAAGRQPENPEVWYRLAQLSLQLADREGFRTAVARFAQLDPVNPAARALGLQATASLAPVTDSATATGTPLPGAPVAPPAPTAPTIAP
jgi:hypothetical protein